jgi:hypothetical protein
MTDCNQYRTVVANLAEAPDKKINKNLLRDSRIFECAQTDRQVRKNMKNLVSNAFKKWIFLLQLKENQ